MRLEAHLHHLPSFAEAFWKAAGEHTVFLFEGQMGAGKTTLIAALCRHLGVEEATSSPTFALVNEYRLPSGAPVYHMDLYRLRDEAEAEGAGLADLVDSGALCFIEWPERAPGLTEGLPHLKIRVRAVDEEVREVHVGE